MGFQVVSSSVGKWTSADGGAHDWLGRACIENVGGGVWATIYRSGTDHSTSLTGKAHIRFSSDEGATWSNENTTTGGSAVTGFPLDGHGSQDITDPVLAVAPNGDLFAFVFEAAASSWDGTYAYKSSDGGATWAAAATAHPLTGGKCLRDWHRVGTDTYFIVWDDTNNDKAGPFKTSLYKATTNDLSSMSLVSDVTSTSENTDEASLVYLTSEDELLVALRDTAAAKTYLRKSSSVSSLGDAWGALRNITPYVGIMGLPHLHITTSGYIYLIGRHVVGAHPAGKTIIAFSMNSGDTFDYFMALESSTQADVGYADMLQRSNGDWYLLTYSGSSLNASGIDEYVVRHRLSIGLGK